MNIKLDLSFPEVLEGQQFLTETEPGRLKSILTISDSQTIKAEILKTTKIVFDLNRCELSLSDALIIIKILHNKYSNISNMIRDYSDDAILINKDVDIHLHQLTREMTHATKQCVVKLESNNKWVFGLPKKLAFAINLALHYLTLFKLEHYQLDKSLPSYLWQELFQLYQFSEVNKLTEISVKDDPINSIRVSRNIKSSFCRTALMASMEPYTLNREESWNTFCYLDNLVSEIKLTKDKTIPSESSYFAFNYAKAYRPEQVQENHKHDENSRYLNMLGFTSKIKQELSIFNASKPLNHQFLTPNNKVMHGKLLQMVYRYSIKYIARASDRYPVDVEAKVIWGFDDIKALITSDLKLNAYPASESFETAIKSPQSGLPTVWQAVNQSQGGSCIEEYQHKGLKVNNSTPMMIALDFPGQRGAWQFALSRWHKSKNSSNIIGLQYVKGPVRMVQSSNKELGSLIMIGPDHNDQHFLFTPHEQLKMTKNMIIQTEEGKLLVSNKGILTCENADLVKIEIVKKST
ncbi:hypothetical protein [Kangiella sp. HZ709]|uniref:hypothetical protein n=1 Tax=Kangiella sp. HZ709 TaxID=2666328 RepID=UPI0012B1071F|nr:hypothetical protein [Kangiella sp. HZ709]MRX27062.1 hypothetical protein [Kangiella sp. HZ709]